MKPRGLIALALLVMLLAPLAGGLLKGLRPGFFDYPPLEVVPPVHAPFSGPVFALFAVLGLGYLALLLRPAWFGFQRAPPGNARSSPALPFPPWGWGGVALTAISWTCAWGRFAWLGVWRDHMFAPLWFGYVLTMDGLAYRRRGTSLLARAPIAWAVLFPASALTWWYFEYLNRFARNWYYRGLEGFGAAHYVIHASLCFSTVLPAIFETYDWLRSFARFGSGFSRGPAWKPLPGIFSAALAAAGVILCVLIGAFPDPFFFALWVAPTLVLAPALHWSGVETPFHRLRSGDYGQLVGLATAALVCGFFWEMWNFRSLPQWNYSVPYVQAFKVFEMPVVGYTGYLPFGPLCGCFWLAWRALLPDRIRARLAAAD